jgi:DNA-binding transcriptional LysR family regulator
MLHSVLTVDSHQAIISAIQHHVGMGIIASHLVSKEIQRGQIIAIKTSKSKIKNQITLIQLLDKVPTLTEKIFQKFLLKKIELIGLQIEVKSAALKKGI